MMYVLFGSFALLVFCNVPIAASLCLATIVSIVASDSVPMIVVGQKLFASIDSFPLMAIPFFMIAGNLMEKGGISTRLIAFANTIIGSLSGGLALVTVLASMFFAAISGSSPATVAAIGSIMIPAMVRQGYSKEFAAATQASAGFIGVIIPPSIPMVTFGVVTGTSIGTLFIAGFVPGALFGLALMIVAYVIARRNKYTGDKRASMLETFRAFKDSIIALLMPIIILGGIYGGIFTPTEAANVAVVYGLVVGLYVYRELKWSDIPEILKKSAISSSLVMLIIATASSFGLILTREAIPAQIAEMFLSITSNPAFLLVLINIMLLVIGTFMETNAAIIIMAPIFFPVIMKMGIDPVHFGVIMVANLAIGMVTPPLGVNLFVACGLTKLKIEQVVKANWWYLAAALVVMGLITYLPSVSMWLPSVLM